MSKKIVIDHKIVCESCKGTGLYVGFAERDGAAVVCKTCEGTGCFHLCQTHELFEGRKERKGIKRVYATNPGWCIGEKAGVCTLEGFGGMPYSDWASGNKFPSKSELRRHVCPSWWYQSADYDRKPKWEECIGCGSFRECKNFPTKEKCWERFDKEGL